MLIAGEASGDLHAANFVKALKKHNRDLELYGIAGPMMRNQGVKAIHDASELAVMGLIEPLLQYRRLFGVLDHMRELLRQDPPDLLVLTDYPGFNLRLAETAKSLGVKVLFYISPQVWAWRQGRVKKIGERIDMMAVIFPFEAQFYERFNIPVRYVGHPLVDEVKPSLSLVQAQDQFGLDRKKKTVGLFPGSRRTEVKRLLPVMLKSAERLLAEDPEIQFILPIASGLNREMLQPCLDNTKVPVIVVDGQGYDVAQTCDAVITASGTATLELAMLGIPMVITYKVAWLTYKIVHRMLKIPYIGLANIVAEDWVAKEFVQHKATAANIAPEISRLIHDSHYHQEVVKKLSCVKEKMGESGGSDNLAQLALEMLDNK